MWLAGPTISSLHARFRDRQLCGNVSNLSDVTVTMMFLPVTVTIMPLPVTVTTTVTTTVTMMPLPLTVTVTVTATVTVIPTLF